MSETLFGLLQKTSSHARPKQIAWAVVWGVACGLLPKSSLLFPLALLVSFLLPVHLLAAGVCMMVTSLFASLLHPLLGNLGHWIFAYSQFSQLVNQLDAYPLVPWLKLHNTVVVGTLIASAVLILPTYWVLQQMLSMSYVVWLRRQYEAQLFSTAQREAATENQLADRRSALSSPWPEKPTTQQQPVLLPKPIAATLSQIAEIPQATASEHPQHQVDLTTGLAQSPTQFSTSMTEVVDSIHSLEDLLDKIEHEQFSAVDADAVLKRATKATQLIDEILQTLDRVENSPGPHNPVVVPGIDSPALASIDQPCPVSANAESSEPLAVPVEAEATQIPITDQQNTVLGNAAEVNSATVRIDAPQIFQAHDTTISIYRRARTGDITVTSSAPDTLPVKDPMTTANQVTQNNLGAAVVDTDLSRTILSPAQSDIVRHSVDPRHDEEALRHLLTHLRALKEKV